MKKSLFNNKLPSNWEWVILDELLIEKPCNGLYKSANFIGKGTLFLDINGLYKGLTADFSQARRVEITENECRQYELVKGDILFNRVSKMPEGVGKAVAVGELQEAAVYESNMIRVRLNKQRVDSLFVVNYLSTNRSRQELLSKANISNQASINQQAIKSLAIPLPPITEQRRILTILDRAQSLISKRREAIAQLDTLTQAIFLEMFGNPVTNPKGWKSCPVGSVTDCIVPGRDKPKSFSGKIPWITTDVLSHLGVIFNSPKGLGLSEAEINEVRAKVIPKESVIISCVGDLGIASIAGNNMVINQQLHAFQCHKELLNNVFLMYCLAFQKIFMFTKASSTTVPYMNKSICNSIPIFLPPLSLQQEFARRIEAVEKLKAAHRASLSELNALFASLQHRAFRGEL